MNIRSKESDELIIVEGFFIMVIHCYFLQKLLIEESLTKIPLL